MISSQDKNIKSIIATLARTLSPTGKYKRNDIARAWLFDGSSWMAEEVYDEENPKQLIGVKLASPEFDDVTTTFIEYALAALMGQRTFVNDCTLIDVQHWGERYPDKHYDCGYETMYRIKADTLRITIQHQGSDRGRRKSTAVAALRRHGTLAWKTLCELRGERIRSRDEFQYREKRDYEPANAHLFHADEQELFRMALGVLYH
ncbi:MAG: hypothetical protein M3362_02385 [Acidobacteriota bacterium]|nr:hypothetical protein [Acidobacteriota bacterium]